MPSSLTAWQLRPVQYSKKCTGGRRSPVLFTGSTPVLQGSHHGVHYCVRLRGKRKKKKEEGAERERGGEKTCLFVWEGPSRKVIFLIMRVSQQSTALPLDLQQHLVHPGWVSLLSHTAVTHRRAPGASQQRHPGLCWWWEPTSEWFPWILMWRIVCFIEEQKEARWLPFRICKRGAPDGLLEFLQSGGTWSKVRPNRGSVWPPGLCSV